MGKLAVDMAALSGFGLDLHDITTSFSSNAGRLLPGVTLPEGTTGLLATLAPALAKFRTEVSSAHRDDLATVDGLGTHLVSARREYGNAEVVSTDSLATAADAPVTHPLSGPGEIARFGGLHLPDLPEVAGAQVGLREIVSAGMNFITPYDEPLHRKIGLRPAKDYLEPLVADWEELQSVGERIGLLGVNDHATSENISGGTAWLQTGWTRLGSQAFGHRAGALRHAVAERSWDMDAVSKIVRSGGESLERLVHNQTVGLVNDISRPMTFVGLTLPLGVWALLTDHPMRESYRSEILSAVDSMKSSAKSRHDDMTELIGHMSSALNYSQGRTSPTFDVASFQVPKKMAPTPAAIRYGFGDNTWWQNGIAV
ncbi:hypothetical protein ACFYTQ_13955 [Nocardia sp. NPDC004068]|uniref:hypothetical protein n=1 Tax=Nocardia sp. NPDC004068 TaxID=3364303 RepID=UPI003696E465